MQVCNQQECMPYQMNFEFLRSTPNGCSADECNYAIDCSLPTPILDLHRLQLSCCPAYMKNDFFFCNIKERSTLFCPILCYCQDSFFGNSSVDRKKRKEKREVAGSLSRNGLGVCGDRLIDQVHHDIYWALA